MNDLQQAKDHLKLIGLRGKGYTTLVLVAEALNRGLEVGKTSTGKSAKIRHEGRSFFWRGGVTNHNSPLSKKITQYKDVCNRHLRNHGINAPENAVFKPTETERAWQWAQPLGKLVVKPHNGIQGNDVHAGLTTYEEFESAFRQVSHEREHILVEQFQRGTEHRALVVDSTVVAVTERRPASVLGDGQSTVQQLVDLKNQNRRPIHANLLLGPIETATLAKAGYDKLYVPAIGERVFLRLTSNLHTGGDALDATEELAYHEREMIERAARSIPGLRVAGFDVLLPREDQPGNDVDASILEINSNPMISMHHFPWEGESRNVAGAILDSMFPTL